MRRPLGRGGYGEVFEVFDRERGDLVAVKRLHRRSPAALAAFKREFRTLSTLSHPGLPLLHELFVHDGTCFFTMELLRGSDLRASVAAGDAPTLDPTCTDDETKADRVLPVHGPVLRAPAEIDRVRALVAALVPVLAFVHRAGLAHCDLKPANVHVGADGRVVLLDFGLARALHEGGERFAGTPAYAAPEQSHGTTSPAVDLYALGSLVFEMVTGAPPFGRGFGALEEKQRVDAPSLAPWLGEAGADLSDLVSGLLARDPLVRGGAIAAYAPRPFVGRAGTIADIEAATPGTVFVLEGPSGIGKTALLRELRARARGAVVLEGRAAETEHVPFNLFDGVADGLADGGFVTTEERVVLARAFPILGDTTATPSWEELTEALRGVFRRIGPCLLHLDDVQWADADSRRLLTALTASPAPPLVLVLAGQPSPWIAAARLGGDLRRLRLGPLTRAESAALASAHGHVDPSRILDETHGHPLFLEELLQADPSRDRPHTLDEAITRRLRPLDDETRRVLALLALALTPPDARTLAAVADHDAATIARALDRLRAGRFVRLTASRGYAPFHQLIARAVLATLDPEATRLAHDAFARVVRTPELLCHHLEGAGRNGEAADVALTAADRAHQALAFDREAKLVERRLALVRDPPALRDALRARRADALRRAGRSVAAAAELAALGRRAEAARLYLSAGALEEGRAVLEALLEAHDEPVPRGAIATTVALVRERLALAAELRLPAALLRSAPDDDRLLVLRAVAEGFGMVDNRLAAVFHTRAMRLSLRSATTALRSELLAIEAIFVGSTDRAGRAAAELLLTRAGAPFAGSLPPRVDAFVATARSVVERHRRPSQANIARLVDAEAKLEALREGDAWAIASVRITRARGLRILGDVRAFRALSQSAMAEAEERQDEYLRVTIGRATYWLELAADRPAGALDVVTRTQWPTGDDGYHFQDFLALEAKIETALYEGRPITLERRDWMRLRWSPQHHVATMRVLHRYLLGRALLWRGRRREVRWIARALAKERTGYALTMAHALMAGVERRDAHLRAVVRLARTYELASLGANAARLLGMEDDGYYAAHAIRRPDAWARIDFPNVR